jgi:hypothetical protein
VRIRPLAYLAAVRDRALLVEVVVRLDRAAEEERVRRQAAVDNAHLSIERLPSVGPVEIWGPPG